MKAICVTPTRDLEIRDVPAPKEPAPGHVLVKLDSAAINHGDKTFLKLPAIAGNALATNRRLAERQHDVWGASGAGTVIGIGAGVPKEYAGRQVAMYRSLSQSAESVGMWSEIVQLPWTACLVLPEQVSVRNYSGSLVNVITAYAFLEEIAEAGHRGVIASAGNSATGRALAALARERNVPAILLARTRDAQEALHAEGVEHVIVTDEGYTESLAKLAAELNTTAVFDGVGGTLAGNIAPALPMNSTFYFYGFLGGAAPISVETRTFMMKNLMMRRFSNFDTDTVKVHERLVAALKALQDVIANPMFATQIGKAFGFENIGDAMAYAPADGGKAILLP